MTPEQPKALGLEEDGATQEQIDEAFTALVTRAATAGESEGEGDEEVVQDTPPNSPPVVVPQQEAETPKLQIPEGMALIDAEALEEMKVAASQTKILFEKDRVARREELLAAAMMDGKFGPAQAARYRSMFDRDAEGTEEIIKEMASGSVPVQEIGRGDDVSASTGDEYPAEWANLLGKGARA